MRAVKQLTIARDYYIPKGMQVSNCQIVCRTLQIRSKPHNVCPKHTNPYWVTAQSKNKLKIISIEMKPFMDPSISLFQYWFFVLSGFYLSYCACTIFSSTLFVASICDVLQPCDEIKFKTSGTASILLTKKLFFLKKKVMVRELCRVSMSFTLHKCRKPRNFICCICTQT